MSEQINQKVGKATGWSLITELATKLVSPIVNIVLARLLAPDAFGIVATITMVISFAEIFTDAGFQKFIVQREFEGEEELNKSTDVAFWTNLSLSILICIIIFSFRGSIAELVGSPGLGDSISIASLLIIIAAFSSIQMARYKRDMDFKTLFYVRIGTAIIPLVVTIPLALWLKNYWALLIGTLCTNLFSAVVLTWKSKWKPSFFFSFKLLKQMLSFSIWTLLASIATWATSNVGIFIVGTQLSEHYLGIYKTSMSTVNSYMAIITSSITPVLFSALSRYQNNNVEFRKTYFSFQNLASIIVIPMGIGIFVFRDFVTDILLGEQWVEAANFIGLWGLTSAFIIIISNFDSEVYRSKGRPEISFFGQLIHIAVMVPTLILTVGYGFEVLYVARSLVRVQGILTSLIIMHFMFGFKVHEILYNILPQTISAVIMGAAGWALLLVRTDWWWQIISVLICIVVYFAVLFIFPSMRKAIFGLEPVRKVLRKLGLLKQPAAAVATAGNDSPDTAEDINNSIPDVVNENNDTALNGEIQS